MHKFVLLSILLFASSSASAECLITSVRDADTAKAFQAHGGWTFNDYDRVCMKLKRANARIQITGMAVVLGNKSIGWASLSVIDADSDVSTNDFSSWSTHVNDYASQNKADELMVLSINSAADSWVDLDKALESLELARQRTKARFRRQPE